MRSGIYIIHYTTPNLQKTADQYGGPNHYVGSSENLQKRIRRHFIGMGSQSTKHAYHSGIQMRLGLVVETIPSIHWENETIKRASQFCRICSSDAFPFEFPPYDQESIDLSSLYWDYLTRVGDENWRKHLRIVY